MREERKSQGGESERRHILAPAGLSEDDERASERERVKCGFAW